VDPAECKRPYDLRKRQESSERSRAAVVEAAKEILAREGYLQFTMAAIAKESGLTRQTVHNLFGTKVDVIEALFDDIAYRAGMQNMHVIMQSSDPAWMTGEYLRLMVSLWSEDRVLIRRIHGLRAIDPELGAALNRRDQRKKMAIGKIMNALESSRGSAFSPEERQYHESILYAFTSFEVYEQLAESLGSIEAVSEAVLRGVGRALNLNIP
jgi:AcrR family transcriptional regulator